MVGHLPYVDLDLRGFRPLQNIYKGCNKTATSLSLLSCLHMPAPIEISGEPLPFDKELWIGKGKMVPENPLKVDHVRATVGRGSWELTTTKPDTSRGSEGY